MKKLSNGYSLWLNETGSVKCLVGSRKSPLSKDIYDIIYIHIFAGIKSIFIAS